MISIFSTVFRKVKMASSDNRILGYYVAIAGVLLACSAYQNLSHKSYVREMEHLERIRILNKMYLGTLGMGA